MIKLKPSKTGISDFSDECEFSLIPSESINENIKRIVRISAEQSAVTLWLEKDMVMEVLSESSSVTSSCLLPDFLRESISRFNENDSLDALHRLRIILESAVTEITDILSDE